VRTRLAVPALLLVAAGPTSAASSHHLREGRASVYAPRSNGFYVPQSGGFYGGSDYGSDYGGGRESMIHAT
jgi:hypothetical protein